VSGRESTDARPADVPHHWSCRLRVRHPEESIAHLLDFGLRPLVIPPGLHGHSAAWLGERFSADLALVVPTDGGSAVAFPLVNVVYSFSR